MEQHEELPQPRNSSKPSLCKGLKEETFKCRMSVIKEKVSRKEGAIQQEIA